MKKPIAIIVVVLLAAAVLTGVVSLRRPRELVHEGKPVSAWAIQLYGPVQREEAAAAFERLGVQAVPDLIRMLRVKDPMLAKPLYPPPQWLPKPLQLLIRRTVNPADASTKRLVAAHAAGTLGAKAAPTVPALGALFTGGNPDERWAAATALGRIATPEAVNVCVNALHSTNADLHHPAVYALGEMGAAAAPALPAVLECLRHQQDPVRASAIYTLSRIGQPALDPMIEAVRQMRGPERRAAAQALIKLSPSPRVTLPPLLQMLDDEDPRSRLEALRCLLTVAPWHKDVGLALTNLLNDPAAGEALAKAGPVKPAAASP